MTTSASQRPYLPTPHTWRERVALDNVMNWPSFWISALIIAIAYAVLSPQFVANQPLSSFIAVCVGQLTAYGVLLFAQMGLRGARKSAGGWYGLSTFVLAGIVRGVVIAHVHLTLGLTQELQLPLRIAASVETTTTVLIVIAMAADAIREQRLRLLLTAQLEQRLEHVVQEISTASRNWRQGAGHSIADRLRNDLQRMSSTQPHAAVDLLRNAAHEVVRPLSHELATASIPYVPSTPTEVPRSFDWKEAVADATTGGTTPWLYYALAVGYISSAWSVSQFPLVQGVAGIAVLILTLWLGGKLIDAVLTRTALPAVGARIALFTFAVTCLSALAAFGFWLIAGDHTEQWVLAIGTLVLAPVGWMFALIGATQLQQERTLAELDRLSSELDWQIARANGHQWQQQQELARFLHGPLQASLNAAALRLDQRLQQGSLTEDFLDAVRQDVEAHVNALPDGEVEDIDLQRALHRIVNMWSPLCAIDISVARELLAQLTADAAATSALTQIVTEGCSNAIRHGKATHIAVSIVKHRPGHLRLIIVSDGHSTGSPRPGLGSQMLDDISLEWSFGNTESGTKLMATIPTVLR